MMVLLIIIPIKWLFHWGYTPFSDKPILTTYIYIYIFIYLSGYAGYIGYYGLFIPKSQNHEYIYGQIIVFHQPELLGHSGMISLLTRISSEGEQ